MTSKEMAKPTAGRADLSFNQPWSWRPSPSAWFERLAELADRWEPSAELGLDSGIIQHALIGAAETRMTWLRHPCVSAITYPGLENRLQRDFQLAIWAAAHTDTAFGPITVPEPLWAWGPDGGYPVAPGTYDVDALGERTLSSASPGALALDVWARSINVSFIQLWRDAETYEAAHQADLRGELKLFLRASTAMEKRLVDCFDWVAAAVQVVVPLRQTSGEHSASSSSTQLPGTVFLTLQSELQIVEALVHESAHQHLYTAEAESPLVDPSHTATYPSPLRSDPRPLRGVLLAFHALAYIAASYFDALEQRLVATTILERQLQEVRTQLQEAEHIILANRRYLTKAGESFVERTVYVGQYSA